ncbi:NAD(P)H-binding protein [Paraburkholderia tropica]|uniref:NAD(P)H-binding protein n=1 Tax=Paraburkholderia tropica TaxID=92647 RepID=UPI003D2C071A
MRIFITGATGFIGSALVRELVTVGHAVTGLVRSAHAVALLEAMGARACLGTIEDPDLIAFRSWRWQQGGPRRRPTMPIALPSVAKGALRAGCSGSCADRRERHCRSSAALGT